MGCQIYNLDESPIQNANQKCLLTKTLLYFCQISKRKSIPWLAINQTYLFEHRGLKGKVQLSAEKDIYNKTIVSVEEGETVLVP